VRVSKDGLNNRVIGKGLVAAYAFDEHLDQPSSVWSTYGLYVRDLLGSSQCLVGGANPAGPVGWGSQTPTAPLSLAADGIYLGGYVSQLTGPNKANCLGSPLPLSGNPAFTAQMIVKFVTVSPSAGQLLFELMDPTLSGTGRAHKDIYLAINAGWQGGAHLDVADYVTGGYYVTSTPGWSPGNYYLVTLVKTPGPINTSTVKLYVGGTAIALSTSAGTPDGQPLNLSPNLKIRLGCWGFGTETNCDPGGGGATDARTTFSWFSLYDRALSADEVVHNHAALKAAMAQGPRNVIVQ
jgi:hypothetical protein